MGSIIVLPKKEKCAVVRISKKPQTKLNMANKQTKSTLEKTSKLPNGKKIIFDSADDVKVKLQLSNDQILLLEKVS